MDSNSKNIILFLKNTQKTQIRKDSCVFSLYYIESNQITINHSNTYELDMYNENHVVSYYAMSTCPKILLISLSQQYLPFYFYYVFRPLFSLPNSIRPTYKRALVRNHSSKLNDCSYRSYFVDDPRSNSTLYATLDILIEPNIKI